MRFFDGIFLISLNFFFHLAKDTRQRFSSQTRNDENIIKSQIVKRQWELRADFREGSSALALAATSLSLILALFL